MDSMEPAAGAGTSTVTLSVSSSSSGSSRATLSPSFLNQRATVASVTDSPIAGTLISTVILISFEGAHRALARPDTKPLPRRGRGNFSLQYQGGVQERLEFGVVLAHQARGGRGVFRPADIARTRRATHLGDRLFYA